MISQRPEVKENPINKENLRFILQRAETQQDSLTQKNAKENLEKKSSLFPSGVLCSYPNSYRTI